MRAMRAESFGGYRDLKFTDIPSPALSDGRVFVRMTAAGVTPSITRFSLANIR
jgi:NADPH2:quinone reductase